MFQSDNSVCVASVNSWDELDLKGCTVTHVLARNKVQKLATLVQGEHDKWSDAALDIVRTGVDVYAV